MIKAKVSCVFCGKVFNRNASEVKRNIKLKRNVYCSIACFRNYFLARGEKKQCSCCGNEIIVKPHNIRNSKTGRFYCNASCAAKITRNRLGEPKFCLGCKKTIDRQRKYCSYGCRRNYLRTKYINDWLQGNISGGSGEGAVSDVIRDWLFQRADNKCEGKLDDGSLCQWSRIHPVTKRIPLTVNHKDGNSENHRPENLELLCAACHSLTPNFGSLNKGRGRKKRLKKIQNLGP